jgi:hypothetical protein
MYDWMRSESESEFYVTTDSQSASLSCNKAPIGSPRPDLYYCHTVASVLTWSALSNERAVCPYFLLALASTLILGSESIYSTVTDSRPPFPSSPTTRRAKVEVLDPASTRDWMRLKSRSRVTLRLLVYRQSVRLGARRSYLNGRLYSPLISMEPSFYPCA